MSEATTILLILSANVLFLCLGFYFGRLSSYQGIPKISIPWSKPKQMIEKDPYTEAMKGPEPARKETIK